MRKFKNPSMKSRNWHILDNAYSVTFTNKSNPNVFYTYELVNGEWELNPEKSEKHFYLSVNPKDRFEVIGNYKQANYSNIIFYLNRAISHHLEA